MSDNGAKALADRLAVIRYPPVREVQAAGPSAHYEHDNAAYAGAILADGSVFLTADEIERLLTELAESPLPGARYAHDVVSRRLRAALGEPTP